MQISPNNGHLIENGHLTDEALAIWATALLEDREKDLPQALLLHVDECMQCKKISLNCMMIYWLYRIFPSIIALFDFGTIKIH